MLPQLFGFDRSGFWEEKKEIIYPNNQNGAAFQAKIEAKLTAVLAKATSQINGVALLVPQAWPLGNARDALNELSDSVQ